MSKSDIRGVYPVLPTIFHNNGDIDFDGVRSVLEFVLEAGVDGVVFPGLASEYDCLSADERTKLVSLIAKWTDGRTPFLVGASAVDADEVRYFVEQGASAGADAAMILTPRSIGGDKMALIDWYGEIGEQVGLPLMLQNAPNPMGSGLDVQTVCDIARAVSAIRLVKEETPPCGQRISVILDGCGDALDGVFGGAGGRYLMDELNRGAAGTLPACDAVEGQVSLYRAYQSGDVELAREIFDRVLPLLSMQAVFRWRLTKQVLYRRGVIKNPYVRARGPQLDSIDKSEIDILLDRLGELSPALGSLRGKVALD